jgi:hypothetical protein
MVQIGTFLLAHVFSALLPPVDPNEDDFYGILGLELNATNEQIRKAYKIKSLKLHPDKVAQRGNMGKEEAAAEYEKVQEAYAVLVNKEKKEKYHALKYSSTRYRFIEQGALANPGSLFENLSGASVLEKTRLVALSWTMMLLVLVQPILIAEKINHSLAGAGALADSSWAAILVPYWIFGALGILSLGALLIFAPTEAKLPMLLNLLEQFFWYLAVIFMTEKWEGWTTPYSRTLIPAYVAIVLRWIQSIVLIAKIRSDVAKMVTVEYLEKEVLKGKKLDDLTDEEEEKLRTNYIIITVQPDFEPIVPEGDEETDAKTLEEQKVESSPEYESATDIYNTTLGSLYGSVTFGIIFLILLTLKLDGNLGGSWWTVFTPIWIYVIARILYSVSVFCCGTTVIGDELLTDTSTTVPASQEVNSNVGLSDESKKNDEKKVVSREKEEGDKTPTMSTEAKPYQPTSEKAFKMVEREVTDSEKKSDTNSEPEIHIDEETYKAWQSAYAEANESAIEAQSKAAGDCCKYTFQMIFLCLVVAKIEEATDSDAEVGFNVLWILFPFFLIFACLGVSFAMLIYGATSDPFPGMDGNEQEGFDVNEVSEQVDVGEDVENPTPTSSSNSKVTPAPSTEVDEPEKANNASNGEMEDLD